MVLMAAVLFGTTGTAQALGPDATDPTAVGAARVLGAAVLLLLAARRGTGGVGAWAVPAVLVGGLGVAGYQLSFFEAVDRTGVAVGTVVALGSGPAFAGLAGRIANSERLTRRWAGATALACAGVALLVGGGDGADVDPAGIALALLAGASYATYTVAAKSLLDHGDGPESVMARFFAAGALLLLPVLLAGGGGGLGSAGGVALVVYLAAIPTALAYVLFANGLRHLSSGETATLTLAEPLTATVLGIVVLSEDPSTLTAAGAALILAGLVALALPGRSGPPAPEAEAVVAR